MSGLTVCEAAGRGDGRQALAMNLELVFGGRQRRAKIELSQTQCDLLAAEERVSVLCGVLQNGRRRCAQASTVHGTYHSRRRGNRMFVCDRLFRKCPLVDCAKSDRFGLEPIALIEGIRVL